MAGEALLPLALVVLLLLPPLARSFAPIPAGDSASWFGLRVSKGAWSRVFLPETIFTLLSLLVASAVSVAASLFGSPYPITTFLCLAACVGALLRIVLACGSPGGSRAPSHCPLTGSPYTTVTPIVTRAAALRGPTDTFSSAFAALTAAPVRTLPSPWRVQPVVLVIAHPDDESMFFSPLLASLFASNETQFIAHASPEADTRSAAGQVTVSRLIYEPHVLCLSTGGADGLGKLRPAELVKAAALLGVSPDHTRVIDDPALPDSMTSHWDPAVVAAHIHEYIADLPVSPPPSSSDPSRLPACLVTFDGAGASGHANHCAVARGAALIGSQSYSRDVYAVESESTGANDDVVAAAGSMSLSNSDHNEDGDSEEGNDDSVSPLPPSKASQKSPMRRTSRSRSTSSARVASSSLPRISANEANAGIRVWHLQTMPLLLRYLGPISPLLCLLPLPLPLHLPQPYPQSPVAAALAGAKAAWGALLRASSQSQKVEFPSAVVLTHPSAPAVAQAAMRRHRSQWVWYRRLYVLFSWHAHVTVLTRAADD